MKRYSRGILLVLLFCLSIFTFAQQNTLAFGLNVTHFNDWKNRPLNFFNPEIRYIKALNPGSSVDIGLNAFYNQGASQDFRKPGGVFQRLIFTTDVEFKKHYNKFSAVIGPTFRYRNEKIRASCTSCPLWEFRTVPKKGYFDFGGVTGLNYEFILNKKSAFELRTTYRLYYKGVNPISFGFFYNRQL